MRRFRQVQHDPSTTLVRRTEGHDFWVASEGDGDCESEGWSGLSIEIGPATSRQKGIIHLFKRREVTGPLLLADLEV